jgi:urea carboxylase
VDNTDYKVRLDGEENILIEFGEMELNIELRFRVHILMQELEKQNLPIIDMTPGIRSLQVHFHPEEISTRDMVKKVVAVNEGLTQLEDITVPSRVIKLPLSWDDPQTQLAAKRYQQTVRPDAPWCPSNPEFIRRINGLDSIEDVMNIVFEADYLVLGLGDVYLGAPVATPTDPRHRMVTTKYNPARPWTPENAVGIGGAYLCVYGMEGPGGYQFVGRTIQMWNPLRETKYFKKDKPWLLNFFDQIKFYPCSADEILKYREDFLRGEFDIEVEETEFNLGNYKKYLESIKESSDKFKAHQEASFEAERQRWHEQGLDQFVSETEEAAGLEEIELPEGCEAIGATIPGSVWKVLIKEGQKVQKGEEVVVLESMKMEFSIIAEEDGVIEKVYATPGEQVNAGQFLAAIKKGGV